MGIKWESEFGWVFNQHPDLKFFLNGEPISDPDSIKIGKDPYARVVLNAEQYIRLVAKQILKLTCRVASILITNNVMNEYVVGGLQDFPQPE